MSWNALKCHEISWYVLICPEVSWNVLKCPGVPWNVLKCPDMSWPPIPPSPIFFSFLFSIFLCLCWARSGRSAGQGQVGRPARVRPAGRPGSKFIGTRENRTFQGICEKSIVKELINPNSLHSQMFIQAELNFGRWRSLKFIPRKSFSRNNH